MVAGRGPRPKDPSRRVRADGVATTFLRVEHVEQPPLPDGFDWPEHTVRWWAMWGASPQAELFGSTDWDFLLDTALLHAEVWSGSLGRLPELRLRVAKFGATPEDRARLRFQFGEGKSDGDAGVKVKGVGGGSRGRYGPLVGLPGVERPAAGG